MLLSVNWLKDYLGKQSIKLDPKDLADKITMRGLAVDRVRESAAGLENIIVGRITKLEKHPNADKLQLTEVVISDASDAEKLQIVCGATNIAEGDYVPVALVGTELPGDMKIKKAKIRGVVSNGMLCSGKELQLSDDSDGILKLPKHAKLGEPLSRLLGKNDTVMEFDLTANRGDCLSVLGLAREISPILNVRIREPKPPRFKVTTHRTSNIIKVEIEDPKICPRYVAHIIDSLKITAAPDWIKQRLQSIGIRAVNNIVDVTNFVMFEYGQPLHAFDLRKIESGEIRVVANKKQRAFTLLSGEPVQIEPGDILIQDGDRPIALAGIMGGENTQITDDTTSILLESAAFDPTQIRKTAKRLGLHTDSSKRFERGVDQSRVLVAAERAAALLRDGFDANVYHPPIDTNDTPLPERTISIDLREVRRIIGTKDLSAESIANSLESVGISTHKKYANILNAKFPSHRLDLKETVDVIEEVARIMGYEKIATNPPKSICSFQKFQDFSFDFEMDVKKILSSQGLHETIHYSFTSEEILKKYGAPLDGAVILKNPISEEMRVMRTSLLPSLLETYRYNRNRKIDCQRIFELANTYQQDDASETKTKETPRLAVLMSGDKTPTHWQDKNSPVDFYFVKGLLDLILSKLSNSTLKYSPLKEHILFHPTRAAKLQLGGADVGLVGEIHPRLRNQILETTEKVVLFELDMAAVESLRKTEIHFQSPSKFPSIDIDLAFVVDKAVTYESMIETMKEAGSELLTNVEVFDLYQGENIPLGRRSLAFHLTFCSRDRTLTDSDVDSLRDKITQSILKTHSAQVR